MTINWYWFRWKLLAIFLFAVFQAVLVNGKNETLASHGKPSIAQSCSKITQFAQSISAFTYCFLTTSESNLCRKCQNEMTAIYDSYLSINSIIPDSETWESVCPGDITAKKMADFREYFKNTESVWLSGNCDSKFICFSQNSLLLTSFFSLLRS